jgi:branched-chain amino acid transport system substrate-binding protein
LALALIVVAACGSRRDYSTLLAAQRGGLSPDSLASPAGVGTNPPSVGQTNAGSSVGGGGGASVVGSTSSGLSPASGGSGLAGPDGASSGASDEASGTGVSAPIGAGTTSDGGTPGASATTCSQELSPIVLGSVGTQSGLIGSIIGGGAEAVQAWAAAVDATGGIRCHPVKYILEDDGGDPGRHQELVQQEVEQDHVVAFLQMDSVLTGQSSVAFINAHQIPVVSSEGGSNWFNENPTYFPVFSSGTPTLKAVFAAAVGVAQRAGDTKLGTLNCIEASICSAVYSVAPSYAQEYGVSLVYRGQASLTEPDFTSVCLSAKQAGAQVLAVYMDGDSLERIESSCKSVAYHPLIVAESLGLTPAVASDPDDDGLYGAVVTLPWVITSNPVAAQMTADLQAYDPGVAPTSGTMQGWIAATLFTDAEAAAPDPTTSAGILQGLWGIKNNDVDGTTYPLTFTKGQDAPLQFCAWVVQVSRGSYVAPNGGYKTCGSG